MYILFMKSFAEMSFDGIWLLRCTQSQASEMVFKSCYISLLAVFQSYWLHSMHFW